MSKLPALQFYPGDWRKDVGVQSLTYHDRGVWFEMLMLMHGSEQRGRLLLNGKAMSTAAVSRALGLPVAEMEETLGRLLDAGVASRELPLKGEHEGAIICRRMVRDEGKRQEQIEDGKRGGNPALCESREGPGFVYAIQRVSDLRIRIAASVNPDRRLYKLRVENKGIRLEMLAKQYVANMTEREAELVEEFAGAHGSDWIPLSAERVNELLSTLKGKANGQQTSSSSFSTSTSKQESDATAFPLVTESPVVISLPLAGGGAHDVSVADIARYEQTYPAVDVAHELLKLREWLLAQPTSKRSKGLSGSKRRVVTWLTGEQEKAYVRPAGSAAAAKVAQSVKGGTGLCAERVVRVLADVAEHEIAGGTPAEEVGRAMVSAWQRYEQARPHIEFPAGPEKFFGEGQWKNEAKWSWKRGKGPAVQSLRVVSPLDEIRQEREAALAEKRRQEVERGAA